MAKFKPFKVLSVSRDYTQGMAPALGAEYPGISDRRTGIKVSVLPTLKDGVIAYKWTAEQSAKQLKTAREKLQDITSGKKYKMLLHTADYLNRLVKDLSDVT